MANTLGQDCDDLLSKGFIASTLFGVTAKANADDGLSLWNKFKLKRGEKEGDSNTQNSEFHAQYKGENHEGSVDISSDTSNITFAASSRPRPQIKAKAELELSPKEVTTEGVTSMSYAKNGKISAEYTQEQSKVKLTAVSEPALSLDASTGTENFQFGISTAFSIASKRLTNYDAALEYIKPNYRATLSHTSTDETAYKPGILALAYFHNLSDRYSLAAKVSYDLGAEKEAFEAKVGVQKEINKSLQGKSRFSTTGMAAFSLRQKLGDHVTLITASELNLLNVPSYGLKSYQFGYKIKIS